MKVEDMLEIIDNALLVLKLPETEASRGALRALHYVREQIFKAMELEDVKEN